VKKTSKAPNIINVNKCKKITFS